MTPSLQAGRVLSICFARYDGEGDLQFVFHLDRATAHLHRRDAIVRLQNGNFALAAQLRAFRLHTQGEAHRFLDAVQLQLAGYGQLPSFRVLFRAGNSRRSKGDLGKLGDVQDFLAFHCPLNIPSLYTWISSLLCALAIEYAVFSCAAAPRATSSSPAAPAAILHRMVCLPASIIRRISSRLSPFCPRVARLGLPVCRCFVTLSLFLCSS